MKSVESKPYLVHFGPGTDKGSPFDSNEWLIVYSGVSTRYDLPCACVEWSVPASSMNKDEPCA
jgi:hypothetical protein